MQKESRIRLRWKFAANHGNVSGKCLGIVIQTRQLPEKLIQLMHLKVRTRRYRAKYGDDSIIATAPRQRPTRSRQWI